MMTIVRVLDKSKETNPELLVWVLFAALVVLVGIWAFTMLKWRQSIDLLTAALQDNERLITLNNEQLETGRQLLEILSVQDALIARLRGLEQ